MRQPLFIFLIFLTGLQPLTALAQKFTIIDISTENYPVIQLRYKLTDAFGKNITDLEINDISIAENERPCEITFLKNLTDTSTAYSILMVFDISGSMKNQRLEIAKKAALSFIQEADLERSEIAIATFNSESHLNSDFTQSKSLLKESVRVIEGWGGTNYESAFEDKHTGAFEIMKQAQHKKVVIFMTDGLGSADEKRIASMALKNNIEIYCATIGLAMPPILSYISRESGGDYFQNINDTSMAAELYQNLYSDLTTTDYGVIRWMASQDCKPKKNGTIALKSVQDTYTYNLPIDSMNRLRVMPAGLFIRQKPIDSLVSKRITLYAPNQPIELSAIEIENTNKITFEDSKLPMLLARGDHQSITLSYPLRDEPNASYQIHFQTKNCLHRTDFALNYGELGSIQITYPTKTDTLAVGQSTNIRWKGVSPLQTIRLYYRMNNHDTWKKIGDGNGLTMPWRLPFSSSDSFQIKGIPSDVLDYEEQNVFPGNMRETRIMDVSRDGQYILSRDKVGMTRVWSVGEPRPKKIFKDSRSNFMYLTDNASAMLSYGSQALKISPLHASGIEKYISTDKAKVLACYATLYGDEYKLPSELITESHDRFIVKDFASSYEIAVQNNKNIPVHAAITADKKSIFIINRDYSLDKIYTESGKIKKLSRRGEHVLKAFISPHGAYAYIEQPSWQGIIETRNGKSVFDMQHHGFIRYSPSGGSLLAIDSMRNIVLYDLQKQAAILKFRNPKYFNFSFNGEQLYFVNDSGIHVHSVYGKEAPVFIREEHIEDISISESGDELLVVSDGIARIVSITDGVPISTINREGKTIRKAVFSANNQVLSVNSDYSISQWIPASTTEGGVSDLFSVVSLVPEVMKQVDFGEIQAGKSREKVIEHFLVNETRFPILIEALSFLNSDQPFRLISNPGPFTIEPNEHASVEIKFSPPEADSYSDTLYIESPGGFVSSHIKGEGITNPIHVPSGVIHFGEVQVPGYKDTSAMVVKNISAHPIALNIISLKENDSFQLLNPVKTPLRLESGEELRVDMRFQPAHPGRFSGQIVIQSEGYQTPEHIKLFGVGTNPKEIILKGITMNTKDSLPVKARVIGINPKSNTTFFTGKTGNDGMFECALVHGSEFLFHAEKEGYMAGSVFADLTGNLSIDTLKRTLWLSPVEKGNRFKSNGVFFEFSEATLLPQSRAELDRILQWLQNNPSIKIEIQGHTDSIGSEAFNLQLSRLRAMAVQEYFEKNGISSTRLSVKAFGENISVASNDTEEGRQLNRRVEFLIR